MSETAIKDSILKWLRQQGCYAVKIHGGPMQERGPLDIIGCWHGRFFAIEVKQPRKLPTEMQKHHLLRIISAGGVAFVADSLQDCIHQLLMWDIHLEEASLQTH